MGYYYLLLLVVALFGASVRFKGFVEDPFDRNVTSSICGVFVVVVFLAHIKHLGLDAMGYSFNCKGDALWHFIRVYMQQLLVVPFLFYSGYGVTTNLLSKPNYAKGFLKTRVLSLYLNFAIAVLIYLVVNAVLGKTFAIREIILAFASWFSVGDPTWFQFCLFFAYLGSITFYWFSRNLTIKHVVMAGGGVIVFIAYILIMNKFKPNSPWWFDTALSYPIGCVFALYKNRILEFLKKWYWPVLVITVATIAFIILRVGHSFWGFRHNILSMFFIVFLVMITLKIKFGNSLTRWLGSRVFPIYMYHLGIFMVFQHYIHNIGSRAWIAHGVVIISFVATLIIAWFYKYWSVSFKKG